MTQLTRPRGEAFPGSAPAGLGGGDRQPRMLALERGAGPTIVLVGLAATLAMLPFEGLLLHSVASPSWRFTLTDVEALAAGTIVAWLVLLAAHRRWPRIPRTIGVAMLLLAVVSALSAANAGTNAPLGSQVVARAALAWGLFLVTTDLVRQGRTALVVLGVLLATTTISALVGWVAALNGSTDGLFGAGRLFSVGGVARMAGTWDYPTIAAMAWESALLAVLPLVALRSGAGSGGGPDGGGRRLPRRLWPLLLVAPLLVLGGAILMTLTRGAFLGLAAGLAGLLLVAVLWRSRRLAAVAMITGSLLAGGGVLLYARIPLPVERLVSESDRALYGAEYAVIGELVAAPGSQVPVEVTLTNTGIATWRPDGAQPWQLGVVWLLPQNGALAGSHQVAAILPGSVPPGASVTVQAVVQVPAGSAAMDLAWDMQQAGVVEFSERDVPVAVTHVTIDAMAAGRPEPVTATLAQRRLLYPDLLPILERAELWTAAVRLVEKYPLLGVGPGAYRRVYGAQLGLSRWDTQIHANDLYLELAATTGLLGLAAFLLLVVLTVGRQIRGLARLARPGPASVGGLLVAGSMAATAAALGHGIVDHFLVFVPMAILFWALLGIGTGLVGGTSRPAAGPAPSVDA